MPLRLDTDRLILTPEEPSDAEWLAELFTARGGHRFTLADAEERIAAMQSVVADRGIGVRAIRIRETGDPVGYCGIVVGRGSVREPELAYELLPRVHGRGYATEAARAVLEAAFATGRTRIWATVRAWNTPSFRVLDKLGFRRDHVVRDADGDIVWMVRDS